jgi:hypothetical protein
MSDEPLNQDTVKVRRVLEEASVLINYFAMLHWSRGSILLFMLDISKIKENKYICNAFPVVFNDPVMNACPKSVLNSLTQSILDIPEQEIFSLLTNSIRQFDATKV